MNLKFFGLLLPGVLLLGACKKVKMDQRTGNLATYDQITASRTRLVNIFGYGDLIVNGQLLTDGVKHQSSEDVITPKPTPYFPTTGKMTGTYFLPQEFFNSNDTAAVDMISYAIPGKTGTFEEKFTATDNYNQPKDYYVVPFRDGSPVSAQLVYSSKTFAIPRTISAAADPTHIRVRLLNLTSTPDDANLTGPMSLTYADGSHVGNATNNITPGNVSDYIELPYGTYQFRVLTSDGRQVPGGPGEIDRFSGALSLYTLTYAPVQDYLPGGVYTIVVCATSGFSYPSLPSSTPTVENAFQVVTDITPPTNTDYARIQAANAWPSTEGTLTLEVDNQPLNGSLAYDSVTHYSIFTKGSHYIALKDAKGQLINQQLFTLYGGDNYTIWIYPDSASRSAMLFVQNNLSGTLNFASADGSNNSSLVRNDKFFFWTRFLNFCPDLPLVTFTRANGQLMPDYQGLSGACSQNLAPGQISSKSFQYVVSDYGVVAPVMAFLSKPLIVPGDWLSSIPSLNYSDFVHSPASFYPNGLPNGEPGVYTVALTGRYGNAANGSKPAKLIVVKHTK